MVIEACIKLRVKEGSLHMRSTEERVRMARLRAGQLERKREIRSASGLGVLCGVLLCSLIGTIHTAVGSGQGSMASGLFGAMLLYEDAGGYVLVGVVSFMAAVVVTLLCVRAKKRNTKIEDVRWGKEQDDNEE